MKRGNKFFVAFSNDSDAEKSGKRGRSGEFIEKRNEKLFHRYYYHSRIRQLKYEIVLIALVNDFDLAESTIIQLVGCNTKRIKEIGEKKLTRQKLKQMYPNLSWNDPAAIVEPVKPKEVYKG